MFQQFSCRSQETAGTTAGTTRRPNLHRRPHLNPDGLLLPTAHRKWSPSPTSNTEMDFNQINISNDNRTILPITGTPPFYSSAMAHPNFYSNI